MKLRTISQKCFVVLVVFGLTMSSFVSADGMLIPPPSRIVYETDQKAVIFFDEGVEHLILSITFQGDADDFAWIVPTPAKPEVEKSTNQLFQRLDELTRPEQVPNPSGMMPNMMGALDRASERGVTVLETKQVEYYDINVLESSDSQSLYNWLNDNGYRFPQSGNSIIDEYIQKGWIFTAIKINNTEEKRAKGQLSSGNTVPLKLSFATDQIVYPLKISSLSGVQDDAPEGQISYVDGVGGGKAAKLDPDRLIATDKVVNGFSANNGKVSFNLKKRDDDPVQKIVSVRSSVNSGSETESLSITNNQKNVFQITINKNYKEQYQVDLGSDFKKNEWQKYDFIWEPSTTGSGYDVKFYIDNVERTLNKVYTMINRNPVESQELPRIVVGGDYFEPIIVEEPAMPYENVNGSAYQERRTKPQVNIFRNGDILIDKLEINSNQKNVFRAEFDENLGVVLAEENANLMRVFEKSSQYNVYDQYVHDSMGVLLYIFSEKKYDITGFDVQYAGWMRTSDIENIAKIDGKTPWIQPQKEKYFLTRVYKYTSTSEMTEDIYPQESADQSSFNYAGGDENKMVWIYILIGLALISTTAMVLFVVRKEKGKTLLPMKNGNHELMKKEDKK